MLGAAEQRELPEMDKTIGGSPPLECKRNKSIVPQSLQSPGDRTSGEIDLFGKQSIIFNYVFLMSSDSDSPHLTPMYNMSIPNARLPLYDRYFDGTTGRLNAGPIDPPPAHRSHNVSSVALPQPPPPTVYGHTPSSVIREQHERELIVPGKFQKLISISLKKKKLQLFLFTVPTPIRQRPSDNPVNNPVHSDSLITLLTRYPVMWQGLLALKNDQAAVQMHFVYGNRGIAMDSLPCNSDGSTPPLRIAQRMRLEQAQIEGVARKMQARLSNNSVRAITNY